MPEWIGSILLLSAVAAAWWICRWIARERIHRRTRELAHLAERLGFDFRAWGSNIHAKYCRLYPFGLGEQRVAGNLLLRQDGRWRWELFDYHFGSGKSSHSYGIAAVTGPVQMRRLTLRPKAVADRIWSALGGDDIAFESNEFNGRYDIQCSERQFAYELLDAAMIEFLLKQPAHFWQVYGHVIIVHKPELFSCDELEGVVKMLEGFIARIPGYLQHDRGPDGREEAYA